MSAATDVDLTTVDFHLDVMCPFAYQTSKWIRSVREQTDLAINWKFFSLEEVNLMPGKKHPWEREWSYGWSMMRVGVALRRLGMDHVDAWYELAGRGLHEDGRRVQEREQQKEILAELGHDPALVDEAIADPTTHDEIHADHARVVDNGGYGVPTMFFGDHCLFGPVLMDPPEGEAAMRLWNAVTAWVEFPHLYELQQPKTDVHQQKITDTFRPYLEARDWVSINRGKVVEFNTD